MIVDMEFSHLALVAYNMRPEDKAGVFCLRFDDNLGDYITEVWRTPGVKLACLDGGKVLGVGGMTADGPNRGTLWMLCVPGWERNIKEIVRTVRKIVSRTTFTRVQADIIESNLQARNFIEHLGFKHEGTRLSYGRNGENMMMYAIVKGV